MRLVSVHKHALFIIFSLLITNISLAQQWSLQQCLDTAHDQNRNLQIARNNIERSRINEREAKSNLMPKLTVNADYKYFTNLPYQLLPLSTFVPTAPEGQFKEAQFGVPHNINANLQLAIPLYNPQVYGGIEATKVATEVTELKYEQRQEQIYFEIANLYYNAQILQTQITFIDSNLVNANRLLRNVELLQQQLLATGTDVERLKLQVAQLSTQKQTLDSKFVQLLRILKFTIGIPIDEQFDIEKTIPFTEVKIYNSNISLDSKLMEAQNRLLRIELNTLNKTRYLPTINLIGSYGTTGLGYDKQPNSFLNFYPIGFAGLQISYPLFNGNTTLRRIDQKQIEINSNNLQFNLIQDQNEMQIANAKMQCNTTYHNIETTGQQIDLAKTIYANTVLQQKQGIVSLTEVLLADNALREAQQANVSAIVDYLKADLELKKLTGNIK
jgi:OMF family outer membrane factor